MSLPLLSVGVAYEQDVLTARQRARQVAALLGFEAQDQTRVATAVSEIARNAFQYAGGGRVQFVLEGRTSPQVLAINVVDAGPGIANLSKILSGQYQSSTGMGLGIVGARRLMDQFTIDSAPGHGTSVWLRKIFPRRTPVLTKARVAAIADELARGAAEGPLDELRQQNMELLRTLGDLRARQDELEHLNRELEDTNRGVVALYAELDEKADHLRRADEMKSRFLSNMSHEFRTPLNSVLALSRLLLERTDGPLTSEQERQIGYIRQSAESLTELVNDLLDLAKVEAGKVVIRPAEFEVANLFGALRGMLRPLLVNTSVALAFEDPSDIPPLVTDETKVSQILRNFISNALKFTERGEVRVSAAMTADGDAVVFTVADTGIGIAPEDHERIFEEFTQIDNPVQRRVHGTGLGLPLTRKLAQLLGGGVSVQSEPGMGSVFSATIPRVYRQVAAEAEPAVADWTLESGRLPVLVVEDDPRDATVIEKLLRDSRYQPIVVRALRGARDVLARVEPKAILLDIRLRGEDTWSFLAETKARDATRAIPIIVTTSIDDEQKGLALGADAYAVKPIDRRWLLDVLDRLTMEPGAPRALVVDDDEVWRYLMRSLLVSIRVEPVEVRGGAEALEQARQARPAMILLDLVMPDMSGFDVLDALRADAATREIPVVVVTSKVLDLRDRDRLARHRVTVISKGATSREEMAAVLREHVATSGRARHGG